MKVPKISVIVPIYNVQRYLEDCLDSLDKQTFKDFEVIMVNDGSTDRSGKIMHRYASEHAHFFAYDKPNGGLGQARNFGLQFAKGEYIAFVDSDDIVDPEAYEKMYALVEETHSDMVIGNVVRFNSFKEFPSVLHQKVFSRKKLKAHITRDHELIYDTTAWNKLYRRSFWEGHRLSFPEHMLYEDIPVTFPAHYLANSVDVLDDIVYYWRSRDFGDQSITQNRTDIRNLTDRLKAVDLLNTFFEEHRIEGGLKAAKDYKILNTDLLLYLDKLDEADDTYIDLYLERVSRYLQTVPEESLLQLWPIDRMKYFFVKKKDKQRVLRLLGYQRSGEMSRCKIVRHDGHYYANYLYHEQVPQTVLMIDDNLQVKRKTRKVFWQGRQLTVEGYGYIEKIDVPHRSDVKMEFSLVNEETGFRLPIEQTGMRRCLSNTIMYGVLAKKKYMPFKFVYNYNWSGFTLSIPFDTAPFDQIPYGSYVIEGKIQAGGLTRTFLVGSPVGGIKARADFVSDARQVIHTAYSGNWDLHLIKEKIDNVIKNVAIDRTEIHLLGRVSDPDHADSLSIKHKKSGLRLSFPLKAGQSQFEIGVPVRTFSEEKSFGEWDVSISMKDGTKSPVVLSKDNETIGDIGFAEAAVRAHLSGHTYLLVQNYGAELLEVAGFNKKMVKMSVAAPFPIGRMKEKTANMKLLFLSNDQGEAHHFSLNQTNHTDSFGRPVLEGWIDLGQDMNPENLKHTAFSLFLTDGPHDGAPSQNFAIYSDHLLKEPVSVLFHHVIYEFRHTEEHLLSLNLEAKWGWIERGRVRRAVLRKLFYPVARLLPMKKKTVIFESYWGKNFECNPRALYEYIDTNYPEYKTVWSLRDPLTHIEGHARKVRMHSLKYYYYMGTAKYFVNNVNFPDFYQKRKHAVELQTMHGTPLKTLGLDVPGEIRPGKHMEMYLAKNRRWDYLCVPSDYVKNIAERAFAHKAKVIETGYPRNDKLFYDNHPEKILEIKARLGIPAGKKVIFYAPTWRVKNHFKMEMNLSRLKQLFSDDYVLLVKFHHYVADAVHIDEEKTAGFVFNETSYDDIRDLYLIADVLITDYSSVMFDYAILERPIILFTYDLDQYRDDLRGMYFDIIEKAPGPVCLTNDELIHELQNIDRFKETYGSKLEAFRSMFTSYDHGDASEKCFKIMFHK
ncbi:bifunctional glycosyltransferase/CDP-glycerol:glycerophosphate glycerophosphotransferase [Sporolactobacillus putidus]|uniref:Glycosyltransferase 2-like domain-containing protein n=1 Tax=Sporolactobacillus putidus TaxID=492735 RepID=A0A917VYF2_9BACL|nr:bifunctional glycosyltransferase/CDP-glycerol:glycerophosphate glycerophosphotransferase [Sporolactobacillus putidus]GGL45368.1 hypothetical protein GCM10007968_06820 [Sporolactobacillus putidus]